MKTEKPPVVHAKADLARLDAQETIDFADKCLTAASKSPLGPNLNVETTEMGGAMGALTDTMAQEKKLLDELDTIKQTRAAQTETLKKKVRNYSHKAAELSKGDANLLATCNIEAAKARGPKAAIEIGQIPEDAIQREPGEDDGMLVVSYPRVPGTTSVEIQYKPVSAPESAPWLPEDHIATNALTWTITGLGHKEEVRVRIRAIGATRGPWSNGAIGRAR